MVALLCDFLNNAFSQKLLEGQDVIQLGKQQDIHEFATYFLSKVDEVGGKLRKMQSEKCRVDFFLNLFYHVHLGFSGTTNWRASQVQERAVE